jgi:hypothetical protein
LAGRERDWLSREADNTITVAKVRHHDNLHAVKRAMIDYFLALTDAAVSSVDTSLQGRDRLVGASLRVADIGS